MSRYADLFEETEVTDSVFADKNALNPLAEPDRIIGREAQERALASILQGVNEGYLPTNVSIYGPPGTGKTVITRRLTTAFAQRTPSFEVEYVNLKECRTIFSAANEIHYALTGEKKDAYEGLDGVFEGIWVALETYPEWTVLIIDEIDQLRYDSNYDPNDFFYRLLRGDGKLQRGLNLSAFMIGNELLDVDLNLDSRVESAMDGESVFFPPYDESALRDVMDERIDKAFKPDTVPEATIEVGVRAAAHRWGDARKALRLFRQAGELANEQSLEQVTVDCIEESLEGTEREDTVAKLRQLPRRHLGVLTAVVVGRDGSGNVVQPVSVSKIHERLNRPETDELIQLGQRAVQEIIGELDTMGFVNTNVESKPSGGRGMYVETTFDPEWVLEAHATVSGELKHEAR